MHAAFEVGQTANQTWYPQHGRWGHHATRAASARYCQQQQKNSKHKHFFFHFVTSVHLCFCVISAPVMCAHVWRDLSIFIYSFFFNGRIYYFEFPALYIDGDVARFFCRFFFFASAISKKKKKKQDCSLVERLDCDIVKLKPVAWTPAPGLLVLVLFLLGLDVNLVLHEHVPVRWGCGRGLGGLKC